MSDFYKHQKSCANCTYWTGARQLDTFNSKVQVESSNTQGKCVAPPGVGFNGSDKRAGHSCSGWLVWNALR
jgi:hypothetical protein